jgi:hypothetical protein
VDFLFGFFFSAIGGIYMVYGKRQSDVTYIVAGALLLIYPYFVSNVWVIVAIGALLSAVPYARRRGVF